MQRWSTETKKALAPSEGLRNISVLLCGSRLMSGTASAFRSPRLRLEKRRRESTQAELGSLPGPAMWQPGAELWTRLSGELVTCGGCAAEAAAAGCDMRLCVDCDSGAARKTATANLRGENNGTLYDNEGTFHARKAAHALPLSPYRLLVCISCDLVLGASCRQRRRPGSRLSEAEDRLAKGGPARCGGSGSGLRRRV